MPNFAQRLESVVGHRSDQVSVFAQELSQLDHQAVQLMSAPLRTGLGT